MAIAPLITKGVYRDLFNCVHCSFICCLLLISRTLAAICSFRSTLLRCLSSAAGDILQQNHNNQNQHLQTNMLLISLFQYFLVLLRHGALEVLFVAVLLLQLVLAAPFEQFFLFVLVSRWNDR